MIGECPWDRVEIIVDIQKLKEKFPCGFPVERLPEGAKEENIVAYRICRSGAVEAASFLPTYLDEISRTKENENEVQDIGHYSLSVFEKESEARRMLKFFRGKQPCAIAAKGSTDASCGMTQRTKERTGTKSSHIDWWLYDGAAPHLFFNMVDMEKAE